MKTRLIRFVLASTAALASLDAHSADALVESWFTSDSGKYARLYATDADKNSGNAVSTWSRGAINQNIPARCGVYFAGSSQNWVYIRSTGLASHIMGPWYLNAAHTMIFPNLPKNTATLYRIPRNPSAPATKTLTGLGPIGYFVDGVAMFDTRDAFYWNGMREVNGGGNWNRDAWVNESVTFDPGQAHQPGDGTHHYHANPVALRYLPGDHVDFSAATKTYSESTSLVTKHSPFLAWVREGYPLYGPYGYSNATNSASGVRRMISGYVLRNGQNGTSAYFVSIGSNGAPAFPYNIGRAFYGSPTGGAVAGIAETVVTNFMGGSNSVLTLNAPVVAAGSGSVTLTWSSVEGGTYVVGGTSDFQHWTTNVAPAVTATGTVATAIDPGSAATDALRFYRVTRTAPANSEN